MLVETPPQTQGDPLGSQITPTTPDLGRALADVAALRLLLTGESAVDLPRLYFPDRAAVDAFLRLHEFDTDNPMDLSRLGELHHDATVYLTDTHRYRLPKLVEQPATIHDLFLAAAHGPSRLQRFACMTLKVMHILHHLAGRETVFNTAVSEAQLADRLNTKVFNVIDRLRAEGIRIHEFAAGKKMRESLVTKLLAKRQTWASAVFDKLRFRIVVGSHDEVVKAVAYMLRNLTPFNYVVPEQSQNGLVTVRDLVRVLGIPTAVAEAHWGELLPQSATPQNEFSGPTFRCVNYVADIPLRIDDVTDLAPPAIVFVQAEIQLVDLETHELNNSGENDHTLYKKRQRERVRKRLECRRSDDLGE